MKKKTIFIDYPIGYDMGKMGRIVHTLGNYDRGGA